MAADMRFLSLIQAATDSGPRRVLLMACKTGKRAQEIRARAEIRPGESLEEFAARVHRKVALSTHRSGCLDYGTCLDCRRGREILATKAERVYGCMAPHARAAIDLLARTGRERALPQACDMGRSITRVAKEFDALDLGGDFLTMAIEPLSRAYGCLDRHHCLSCPKGADVLEEMLLHLAEYGMDEWARTRLGGTYQMLS